jgi:hypothetical protein
MNPFAAKVSENVMCTVNVINTFESLQAHVELDGEVKIFPGDEVLVHGNEIRVPYGETRIERKWTELTGDMEFMELLEFSFSGEKQL